MTISQVERLDNGLWKVELPPHQVRRFGAANCTTGIRSIILVEGAVFHSSSSTLECDLENIVPLNIGTTAETYVISAGQVPRIDEQANAASKLTLGKGDKSFLQMCENNLSKQMYEAAKELLTGVRARSFGNLKRGQKKNFSETPDNFWYVIIQPRIDQLQITVRGNVEHFSGISNLEIKDDRGNTRFKVKSQSDVAEALKLIFHAVRKKY